MHFSLSCKAAIKAVVYLAGIPETSVRPGIAEIAEHTGENMHTMGKILQNLVRQGIINSTKGPGGGFSISAAQTELPILSVIEAVDGKDVFSQCSLGLSRCTDTQPCPLHRDVKPIRDQFHTLCRTKHISDLLEPVKNGLAYLALNQIP